MIRLLVALEHGWQLERGRDGDYFWAGNAAMPNPGNVPHWASVLALCKRDLIRPVQIRTGTAYRLTAAGKLYLKSRAAAHAADHG